jgi:DNA-binding MarR family transcriptional regulator
MTHDTEQQSMDETGLARLFRRASRLMARGYHQLDHAHHAQQHVLAVIMEKEPVAQGELLEILDVRSSSLSEVLGKLEHQGMISRERNEKDKRSFVVSATEQARNLNMGRTSDMMNADSLFACLDVEEQAQLRTILEKIVASLKDDPLYRESGRGRKGVGRGRSQGGGRGKGMGRRGGQSGHGRREPRNDEA